MNSLASKIPHGRRHGFTLVEMLVAVTILVGIMVLATQMIGATSKVWKNTTAKIEAFQNARDGFQLMTDELRQATLNTYWDYYDSTGHTSRNYVSPPFAPVAYGRQSELHFRIAKSLIGAQANNTYGVFFQAPLGYTAAPAQYGNLQNLLNAAGFYIEFSDGTGLVNSPPAFLPVTRIYRYRLMQIIQPTESMTVYNYSFPGSTLSPTAWLAAPTGAQRATCTRIVANNIVGLVIWAKATDSPTDTLVSPTSYSYDSRMGLNGGAAIPPATWTPGVTSQPLQMNQMPPILHVAMIAIDEPSAKVLQGTSTVVPKLISGPAAPFAYGQTSAGGGLLFNKPQYMDSDLLTFQTGPNGLASIKPHLNFRVFETTLTVKSARFSTQ